MKNATITKTVNLLDGGCNVCGIIEDENYTLTIDDHEIQLEELTVNVLVSAIALKSGYKREYETDEIDDFTLYKKAGCQVRLKEEYDFLTYSTADTTISTKDRLNDRVALGEMVNRILTTLFELEEVNFSF